MMLRGNLVHLGSLTSHRMVLHRPVNLFPYHLSIAYQKLINQVYDSDSFLLILGKTMTNYRHHTSYFRTTAAL